jgi:hypothetical protein
MKNVKGFAIGKSVIIRADRAGVFAGNLKSKSGSEVILTEARHLWYWSGAVNCSQLAIDGVGNPGACKFPESIAEVLITGVIEIIPMTEKAVKSINGVAIWKE